MPKAKLVFDLSDSDDKQAFERTAKSTDMAMMLWDIMLNDKKLFMRKLESDDKATEREFELIDDIWKHIWEKASEYGIEIEKLIS
jgi:hypothetical protein